MIDPKDLEELNKAWDNLLRAFYYETPVGRLIMRFAKWLNDKLK